MIWTNFAFFKNLTRINIRFAKQIKTFFGGGVPGHVNLTLILNFYS